MREREEDVYAKMHNNKTIRDKLIRASLFANWSRSYSSTSSFLRLGGWYCTGNVRATDILIEAATLFTDLGNKIGYSIRYAMAGSSYRVLWEVSVNKPLLQYWVRICFSSVEIRYNGKYYCWLAMMVVAY